VKVIKHQAQNKTYRDR